MGVVLFFSRGKLAVLFFTGGESGKGFAKARGGCVCKSAVLLKVSIRLRSCPAGCCCRGIAVIERGLQLFRGVQEAGLL